MKSSRLPKTLKAGDLVTHFTIVMKTASIEVFANTISGNHRTAMCTSDAHFERLYRRPFEVEGSDDRGDFGLTESAFEGAQENWHVALTAERRDLCAGMSIAEVRP